MIKLYRQNANSVGEWSIWSEGGTIHISHATNIGGSQVKHQEVVGKGLAGRTLEEQVRSRIESRVSRIKDRGYKPSIEEAIQNPGNQLGLERPMLAQPITKVKNVNYRGAVLQKKLDGHRCLITRQDGELIAYSRQGKRIEAIHHILKSVGPRIGEGTTIDGELYAHGYPLQTLASWIKRLQPNTANLFFVAYDLISDQSYTDRHEELSSILRDVDTEAPGKIVVLPFREYESPDQQANFFKEVRDDRFEGLMLRLGRRGYEAGKRSSSLLKIKEFFDTELKVIDVLPSKEGWGICVCELPSGGTVRASAPGDRSEKIHALQNKEQYIGRWLTVEFAHWTLDNVPFQPTATRWRVDV